MMFWRRPKKIIPRDMALTARPTRTEGIARKEMPDGGIGLSTQITRGTWMRAFGASEKFERTFQLDYLGRDVYDACNGSDDVQTIVRNFAVKHKISLPEAELAVTTFLKTLMGRGLIAMAMDEPKRAENRKPPAKNKKRRK
jgi:hypothetical protein